MTNIKHFCPDIVGEDKECYCLCGCADKKAEITTDLGRVTCTDCIKVGTTIAKRIADLFAYFQYGIMSDGTVERKEGFVQEKDQ